MVKSVSRGCFETAADFADGIVLCYLENREYLLRRPGGEPCWGCIC
jgi:hypothetical protein